MQVVPPPTLTTGGLDGSTGIDTGMTAGGLGLGVTVTAVGGEGVFLGRATRATFGAARVGRGFGVVFARTAFGFGFAFGFGVSFGVGVTRTATVKLGLERTLTNFCNGVFGAADASSVARSVGDAELVDEVTDGTKMGSALAELLYPAGTGNANANAANATTMTAKAISASVDRRGA